MARPKRQAERRGQLVAAAQRAIPGTGRGARLNRVADEAGLTSGAVLYYYPDIDDLLLEATPGWSASTNCGSEPIEALDDPVARLIARSTRACRPTPRTSKFACCANSAVRPAATGSWPRCSRRCSTARSMYQVVLEQGAAAGCFTLPQLAHHRAQPRRARRRIRLPHRRAASVHRLRRRLRADPRLRAPGDRVSARCVRWRLDLQSLAMSSPAWRNHRRTASTRLENPVRGPPGRRPAGPLP